MPSQLLAGVRRSGSVDRLGLSVGELDTHPSATGRGLFDVHDPVMSLDQPADDVEAESGATSRTVLPELREDPRPDLLADPDAGVVHDELGSAFVGPLHRDADIA